MAFITRVRLQNYKSIAACDVELGQLTFLVGPNGSGKSNFLDALRFVSEALSHTLDYAVQERSGINELRRRSSGHPTHFGIALNFTLPDGRTGTYAFRIGAETQGGYFVQREECSVTRSAGGTFDSFFRVENGKVMDSSVATPPSAVRDRLFLVAASGLPDFHDVHRYLSRMAFYNLSPEKVRVPQPPSPGETLSRDGGNLASVLARLTGPSLERVKEYLARIVPGIEDVVATQAGAYVTLEFRQRVEANVKPWRFHAASMSDGTLRALAVLVALYQASPSSGVPLVGVEEPEIALHPAAAGVLLEALRDASSAVQIVVTSHSPDLLDSEDIPTDSLLAVAIENAVTKVARVDEAGRTAMKDKLYTAGELLRMNQLEPDADEEASPRLRQTDLFGAHEG